MKIFFDCEFTGLHQNTTLVSIGLTDNVGRTFYAEFTDFDKNQIDDWLENNVINNCYLLNDPRDEFINVDFTHWEIKGNSYYIRDAFLQWIEDYHEIEMWSDCLSYDWVLFNQLFGHAFNLPKKINYIPFDICTLFKVCNIDPDINREEFVKELNTSSKHNSLHDAKVIRACFYKLMVQLENSNTKL